MNAFITLCLRSTMPTLHNAYITQEHNLCLVIFKDFLHFQSDKSATFFLKSRTHYKVALILLLIGPSDGARLLMFRNVKYCPLEEITNGLNTQ